MKYVIGRWQSSLSSAGGGGGGGDDDDDDDSPLFHRLRAGAAEKVGSISSFLMDINDHIHTVAVG